MITYITKKKNGHPKVSTVSIGDPITIPRESADKLTLEISLEEIKSVAFNMARSKSLGPNGFTAEFYQHFWVLVNFDLKALFDDFPMSNLDISKVNCGIITLVPRNKDANQIQKFNPICLLNVSFNFFYQSTYERTEWVL